MAQRARDPGITVATGAPGPRNGITAHQLPAGKLAALLAARSAARPSAPADTR